MKLPSLLLQSSFCDMKDIPLEELVEFGEFSIDLPEGRHPEPLITFLKKMREARDYYDLLAKTTELRNEKYHEYELNAARSILMTLRTKQAIRNYIRLQGLDSPLSLYMLKNADLVEWISSEH